jgi:hypothetical protein
LTVDLELEVDVEEDRLLSELFRAAQVTRGVEAKKNEG